MWLVIIINYRSIAALHTIESARLLVPTTKIIYRYSARWVVSWCQYSQARPFRYRHIGISVLNVLHVRRRSLQERKVNCVNAATLNVAVGRVVCGVAVEGVPGPRRTPKVRSSVPSFPVQYPCIVLQVRQLP